MKYKTAELTGVLLNAAVARLEMKRQQPWTAQERPPGYSTHWVLGGPIIERERIVPQSDDVYEWIQPEIGETFIISPANPNGGRRGKHLYTRWQSGFSREEPNKLGFGGPTMTMCYTVYGSTMLECAMRAYVGSKLGTEIEMTPEGNPDPRDSYYRETNPHVQAKIAAMQADRVENGQIVRTAEAQRVIDEMDALIRAAGHKWGMFGAEQHWKPLTPGEPPNPFYSIGGA